MVLALYAVLLIRTAWLSEDAYLTLRTVRNLWAGEGLVWDLGERVQVFPHPLWLGVVALIHGITGEFYFTVLFLTMGLSIAVAILLLWCVPREAWLGICGLTALLLCPAFIDYSTSGLDNPLTHLLVLVFLLVASRPAQSAGGLFSLSLLAALASLNRLEYLLLFLPILVYRAWRLGSRGAALMLAAGLAPLMLWIGFAVFYYGFPLPNAGYANMKADIPFLTRLSHGILYLHEAVRREPVALLVVAAGLAAGFARGNGTARPLAAGVVVYLAWLVLAGGDWVLGRPLSVPILLCAALALSVRFRQRWWYLPLALSVIALAGLPSRLPESLTGTAAQARALPGGLVDARARDFPAAGLLNWKRGRVMPNSSLAAHRPRRVIGGTASPVPELGFAGFYQGERMQLRDPYGHTDALLARLPAVYSTETHIGRWERAVSLAFPEEAGTAEDARLDLLRQDLSLVSEGPLWSAQRFLAIWRLNTGIAARAIDETACRFPGARRTAAQELPPKGMRAKPKGLVVDFAQPRKAEQVQMKWRSPAPVALIFLKQGTPVGNKILHPKERTGPVSVIVPERAAKRGYDGLAILPTKKDTPFYLLSIQ